MTEDEIRKQVNKLEVEDMKTLISRLQEWKKLKDENYELIDSTRFLQDKIENLMDENEKLESQLEELKTAFDEVRALKIPQASKNKKTKI